MANYFNCSLDYLFGFSNEKTCKNINTKPFINNLISLLKENKLSIAKALKDMQMSEADFYRWKAGQYPKTANLLLIATYFDVSIDYLVGRSDKNFG